MRRSPSLWVRTKSKSRPIVFSSPCRATWRTCSARSAAGFVVPGEIVQDELRGGSTRHAERHIGNRAGVAIVERFVGQTVPIVVVAELIAKRHANHMNKLIVVFFRDSPRCQEGSNVPFGGMSAERFRGGSADERIGIFQAGERGGVGLRRQFGTFGENAHRMDANLAVFIVRGVIGERFVFQQVEPLRDPVAEHALARTVGRLKVGQELFERGLTTV